ncbi:hypothetical protein CROQUDRAFT_66009 [Cronartium quercuum f. sp. fusiforme G11]|uniref:alpha-galactosidase n=1 Tax=Cronartium quercuum f. sp. fusiforme G11 TaxID=708437 RepID=A0A9P6NBM5_9BASI|nr:hypothetical protein CROQUDRAFT_66009 [Cronartium quercuum f. sp. fusiforme G11]
MMKYPLILALLGVLQASAQSLEQPEDTASSSSIQKTFLGWISWSLQASKRPEYGDLWFNQTNILKQADVLATEEFKRRGFTQLHLDSNWQDDKLDQYGRHQLNRRRFPSGIDFLVDYLGKRGLFLGLYFLPGADSRAVDNKLPILGTNYTADQIIICPDLKAGCKRPPANAFMAGYAIDYNHPGAQAYIDSIVDLLYKWKVVFVKFAGVLPGSSIDPHNSLFGDATSAPDLVAWRKAINRIHRKYKSQPRIWLDAAWQISKSQKTVLKKNADSHRVAIDIAAYGLVMTTFDRVIRNALEAATWSSIPRNQGGTVLDLDAILLADLTLAECRTMVTIWALCGSPIYSGDDLTKLDGQRKGFLLQQNILDLAKTLTHNPAQLLNFQRATGEVSRRLRRRAEQRKTAEDDKRIAREYMNIVRASYQCKEMDMSSYLSIPSREDSQNLKLESSAVSTTDQPSANPLESQVWFAQVSQVIYLGLVNAGDQLPTDGPATIQADLNKLGLKGSLAKTYTITDMWTGLPVGNLSGNLIVKSPLLVTHDCVLYKLEPTQN